MEMLGADDNGYEFGVCCRCGAPCGGNNTRCIMHVTQREWNIIKIEKAASTGETTQYTLSADAVGFNYEVGIYSFEYPARTPTKLTHTPYRFMEVESIWKANICIYPRNCGPGRTWLSIKVNIVGFDAALNLLISEYVNDRYERVEKNKNAMLNELRFTFDACAAICAYAHRKPHVLKCEQYPVIVLLHNLIMQCRISPYGIRFDAKDARDLVRSVIWGKGIPPVNQLYGDGH